MTRVNQDLNAKLSHIKNIFIRKGSNIYSFKIISREGKKLTSIYAIPLGQRVISWESFGL